MDAFDLTCNRLAIDGEKHSFKFDIEGGLLPLLGCANPLDRVYGVLKVIQWPESCGPPRPDYSITLGELVVDVVNRLGRRWNFPSALFSVSGQLGVDEE